MGDAGGGFSELDAGIGDGGAGGVEDAATKVGGDLREGHRGHEENEGGEGTMKLHEDAPVGLVVMFANRIDVV